MYKKKQIREARNLLTKALKENWVHIGDRGLELTAIGMAKREEFTRHVLDTIFEMAVTV
jgi:hypothetical protein